MHDDYRKTWSRPAYVPTQSLACAPAASVYVCGFLLICMYVCVFGADTTAVTPVLAFLGHLDLDDLLPNADEVGDAKG